MLSCTAKAKHAAAHKQEDLFTLTPEGVTRGWSERQLFLLMTRVGHLTPATAFEMLSASWRTGAGGSVGGSRLKPDLGIKYLELSELSQQKRNPPAEAGRGKHLGLIRHNADSHYLIT